MAGTVASTETRYINREWSWLQFNCRVLGEALSPDSPLLERVKFLAIFESNLDEFYMVRVSGLIEQESAGITQRTPDGLTSAQQLEMVADAASPMRRKAAEIWNKKLLPELAKHGIKFVNPARLTKAQKANLNKFFEAEVFPLLTPLMMEPAQTFPFISNRSLNLAVELQEQGETKWARVKIPPVLPRLIPVNGDPRKFILLEDLIGSNLQHLFPGVEVVGSHLFRVVRDADIEIRELEAADLIDAIEKTLRLRRFGDPVLLEVEEALPREGLELLQRNLELQESDTFIVPGRLGMDFLWEIADLHEPNLKFPIHKPFELPTGRKRDPVPSDPVEGCSSSPPVR